MNFSNSKIEYLIIHEIGNKLRNEKTFLSSSLQDIDEDLEKTLLNYFLKSFMGDVPVHKFEHSSSLNLNEMYTYSKEIFHNLEESTFINTSKKIATHLYESSIHPKINRGEIIVVRFSNIKINDESINCIGIFKSEKKESFLKVLKQEKNIKLKDENGINISKIEKGCLIFDANEKNGFHILNIDNNQVTDYWLRKFLNINLVSNDSHKTKEIIDICKNFSKDILSTKYNTETEFSFNNDYINYFEDNEFYDKKNLLENIFHDNEIKEEFFNYYEQNKESYSFDINESFELSQNDVKKEKKKIKNIIKLDTKLELNVLLDKENGTKNIEKGYDKEKDMYFYKIYFNEEIN